MGFASVCICRNTQNSFFTGKKYDSLKNQSYAKRKKKKETQNFNAQKKKEAEEKQA
jgi:hypothetical protein